MSEGSASLLLFYYLVYLFIYRKKFELEITYVILTCDLTLLDTKEISEVIDWSRVSTCFDIVSSWLHMGERRSYLLLFQVTSRLFKILI